MPTHSQQRLRIVDLPLDILHLIFGLFRRRADPSSQDKRDLRVLYSPDSLAAIRNARLVCRVFNELASPLLLPVLRVELTQASLRKAADVACDAAIARGVRAVHVVLRYRARRLVENIREFIKFHLRSVDYTEDSLTYAVETSQPHQDQEELRGDMLFEVWKIREACNWDKMEYATNEPEYSMAVDDPGNELVTDDQYRFILRRAHEEYRRLHEEQVLLVTSGFFVQDLASSVARLPGATSLVFLDEAPGGYHDLDEYEGRHATRDGFLETWTHKDRLMRHMTAPHSWASVEDVEPVWQPPGPGNWAGSFSPAAEHLPARILLELPIALYRVGVQLRSLEIGVFPLTSGHLSLRPLQGLPHDEGTQNQPIPAPSDPAAWRDLRQACQWLESFTFGRRGDMSCRPVRESHPTPAAQDCINGYLNSILSSPKLRDLAMSFHSYALHSESWSQPGQDYYPLGRVLRSVPGWPYIRNLQIGSIHTTEAELAEFCRGLETRHLEVFYIHSVTIASGGNWERILGILKEKFGTKCRGGTCRVVREEIKTTSETVIGSVLVQFECVD